MHNHRAFLSLLVSVAALTGPSYAGSQNSKSSGAAGSAPAEHVSQIDGPVALATGPDGRTWAVWAVRTPGEFDLAISSRDASGAWSAPAYLGSRNRTDEIDPSVAVDENGSVYVAFSKRASGRIAVAALVGGSTSWLTPVFVSGDDRGSMPAIRIVAGQVVIAYRTSHGIVMTDLPLLVPSQIFGIQDGPTGVDPVGMVPKWGDRPRVPDSDEEVPLDDRIE